MIRYRKVSVAMLALGGCLVLAPVLSVSRPGGSAESPTRPCSLRNGPEQVDPSALTGWFPPLPGAPRPTSRVPGPASTVPVFGTAEGQAPTFVEAWTSDPNTAGSSSAAAWGDVDGDGRLDLVFGNAGSDELYLNRGGTLSATADWIGPQNSTVAVALADMDLDGAPDLVAGGRGLRVYLNRLGKFLSTPDWEVIQTVASMAVGDVDGDGDLDVVAANSNLVGNSAKMLFLNDGASLNGPAWESQGFEYSTDLVLGDMDADGDLDLLCTNALDHPYDFFSFGTLVLGRGDFDGDGFDDILTAAYRHSAPGAHALLFRGGAALDDDVDFIFTPGAFLDMARMDFNGDGFSDVVLAADGLRIYYGGADPDTTADLSMPRELSAALAIANAGDLNGDGVEDLAIGHPYREIPYGRVAIFLGGSPPDTVPGLVFRGAAAGENLGSSMAGAGDVNGDGWDDLLVGAYTDPPRVQLYFGGAAMDTIPDLVLVGDPNADQFGYALAGGGDLNGDGFADFAVGDYAIDSDGPDAGRVYVYLGGPVPDAVPDLVLTGAAGDELGASLSLNGDLNQDAFSDLVVGAPGAANGSGRTFVYYGSASPDAAPDLIMSGDPNNPYGDYFGNSVSGAGDVNGDGVDDLIVGTPGNFRGGAYAGLVKVFLGGAPPDTVPDLVLIGADGEPLHGGRNSLYRNDGGLFTTTPVWRSDDQHFSTSAALGDLDGDGDLDALVSNQYGTEFFAPGNLALYRNDGDSLLTAPVWTSSSGLSYTTTALGDIDQDGDLDALACGWGSPIEIYLNQGIPFGAAPELFLTPGSDRQNGLALGDVDDDGDLDLVTADYDMTTFVAVNTLYRNQQRCWISANPMWISQLTDASYDVALADLDLDGDLDLVFANDPKANAYYNDRGTIPTSPSWISTINHEGSSVDAGDLNGDGYPEVILATAGFNGSGGVQPLVALENRAGSLGQAIWSSNDAYSTSRIALGDINRDGWVDLVLANNQRLVSCGSPGEPNAVYVGHATDWFERSATLLAGSKPSWGLALGDLNGDDAVDVAFANGCGAVSEVFLNYGQGFADSPVWSTSLAGFVLAVAAGDIDGDSLPDLVFAGTSIDRWFRNEGNGTFNQVAWSGGAATIDVALGDVDGDGDPDMVAGRTQNDGMYINTGAGFDAVPSWTSVATTVTRAVALGDVDQDGDLDVVCASEAAPNTIYEGLRNPAYRGDPANPTNQLPNNPPVIRSVAVLPLQGATYRITLTAYDVEGDPIRINPEFRFDSQGQWTPVFLATDSWHPSCTGCLATSPDGVRHELTWDVSALPIRSEKAHFRFRYVSLPRKVGFVQHTGVYQAQMGFLVRRPRLGALAQPLSFPTVTVGDTVAAALVLHNEGNGVLTVAGIQFPPGLRTTQSLPLVVPAGSVENVPVLLEPTTVLSAGGEITVLSDDPLNPSRVFSAVLDVRDLEVTSQDLAPDPAPLGEALSIFVSPAPGVRVETGRVFFRLDRPSGSLPAGIHVATLIPAGNGFVGTVPGEAVNELGVSYWIEVENSGITRVFPQGAPDVVFTKSVEAPTEISVSAQANLGSGYLEGFPINVLVLLKPGTVVDSGTLFFRRGGDSAYQSREITSTEFLPQAAIPDSVVNHRGIDYWVEIRTAGGTVLTDPALDPATHPLTLQTTVLNLEEPVSHPGEQYRMVSFPLAFPPEFTGTFAALLNEQPEFGPYDPKAWRAFVYSPADSGYAEISDEAHEEAFRPRPGRAFWLVSRKSHRVDTKPFSGLSTPTDAPYGIALAPGWNQVGNPFAFPVAWSAVLIDGVPVLEQGQVEPPWARAGDGYAPDQAVLVPFDGYWIRNNGASPATLQIPPVESPEALSEETVAVAPDRKQASGWSIPILVEAEAARDPSAAAGVRNGAADGHDRWDRSAPPLGPDGGLSVYFPQGDRAASGIYAVDIRPNVAGAPGHAWALDVAGRLETEREVTMTLNPAQVPEDLEVLLIDRTLNRFMDLRGEPKYRFYLGDRSRDSDPGNARFDLVVGSPEFIQSHRDASSAVFTDRLLQNYPNPFRSGTLIRYEVSRPGPVRIQVFDVQGRLLRTVVHASHEPGRYETEWDGRNTAGAATPPGIYFYRITAAGTDLSRRMVRVR